MFCSTHSRHTAQGQYGKPSVAGTQAARVERVQQKTTTSNSIKERHTVEIIALFIVILLGEIIYKLTSKD